MRPVEAESFSSAESRSSRGHASSPSRLRPIQADFVQFWSRALSSSRLRPAQADRIQFRPYALISGRGRPIHADLHPARPKVQNVLRAPFNFFRSYTLFTLRFCALSRVDCGLDGTSNDGENRDSSWRKQTSNP